MEKPQLPVNESTRIDMLKSLNILDSQAEERFDRITRIAEAVFDVPIALLSLVDEKRQWFKSCIGLDVLETPRDISFCGHAILDSDLFLIEDTFADPRFADNPLVLGEPFIRFYAGYPLTLGNGSRLGTLCIIDTKPRKLTHAQQRLFIDLAHIAQSELAFQQITTLDDLTEIANRRGFYLLAKQTLNLCARQQFSAKLVFLDLDDFKSINDNYGHYMGDRALKIFANTLNQLGRESDVCARLAGDEFVMLLVNVSDTDVAQIMQRLQAGLFESCQHHELQFQINFSYGIAEFDANNPISIEQLLKFADEKMYIDKTSKHT